MGSGLVSFAPVYLNGIMAVFWVFTIPGLILVRAFGVLDFSQRLLAVILCSLTVNYLLVVLIATLHLNALDTYRCVVLATIAALACLYIVDVSGRKAPFGLSCNSAKIRKLDLRWLAFSFVVLCIAYFNIWKSGVPHIFGEGDVSISWNTWAMIWSKGLFPVASYGYPQFIPTIWAITYIFTGSVEHYFAYYTYIVLIIAPIILVCTYLARGGWRLGLAPLLTFVWFVAEVRDPWHRGTLAEAFPDWTAAVCGFCGLVLFMTGAPGRQFDREKIVNALLSLGLILLAAATKPIYGLFALAVLLRLCVDAVTLLEGRTRRRLLAAAIGLFAAFVIAYLIIYLHLAVRSLPHDPVPDLAGRLIRSANLLNGSFTLPFRIAACVGIALCPFLPRVRWLALPLLLGTWLWASTAGYDLRNLFGVLLTSAFVSVFAATRLVASKPGGDSEIPWNVPDGAIAAILAVLTVGLTLPLAQDDAHLNRRFMEEQFRIGAGPEMNRKLDQLLSRGCFIFSGAAYMFTIVAFEKYRQQMEFFHFSLPLPEAAMKKFDEVSGCSGIIYPPARTSAPVIDYVNAKSEERGYVKVFDALGWDLLASPLAPAGG
jgi:hypothetical protein